MRVFKTKSFAHFARKQSIGDATLWQAVMDADAGLIDADLGGGVIKQRVARAGQGKRSGFRTIILYRARERALFVYGFAKNEEDNIGHVDLKNYRHMASTVLTWHEIQVDRVLANGEWIEITVSKEDKDAQEI
ncbi:MAG: type II toxin-antitoxin system RelE/ParE family toxin [Proteobacteria bacterium]|nr:type II toxin-antitoxin system RelE/ParE family toxin [Pseudomonadota bacterium]